MAARQLPKLALHFLEECLKPGLQFATGIENSYPPIQLPDGETKRLAGYE
jgi:hypothetical protein